MMVQGIFLPIAPASFLWHEVLASNHAPNPEREAKPEVVKENWRAKRLLQLAVKVATVMT